MVDESSLPPRSLGDKQRLFAAIDASIQAGRAEMSAASPTLQNQAGLIAATGETLRNDNQAMDKQKTEVTDAARIAFVRLSQKLGRLRIRYWGVTVLLAFLLMISWLALLWKRFWRLLLGLALVAVLSWAGWIYGPPAWRLLRDVAGGILNGTATSPEPVTATPEGDVE